VYFSTPVPAALEEWEARPVGDGSAARCVLVVEKYTVFHRIVTSEFVRRVACVVVTGRGFPDFATRHLLARVVAALGPHVPVLGVCDFNPHGLLLMSAYACGSAASHETDAYACPALRVVGLLAADVDRLALEPRDVEAFSASDDAAVAALLASERVRAWDAGVPAQASLMAQRGFKMDLDALAKFGAGFLADVWLPRVVAPWLGVAQALQ